MIQKELEIINKLGLHARAAAKLVALTAKFESTIEIARQDKKVNAKSIMGVMMLAASKGTMVSIFADGPDEAEAIAEVEALINDKFGEAA